MTDEALRAKAYELTLKTSDMTNEEAVPEILDALREVAGDCDARQICAERMLTERGQEIERERDAALARAEMLHQSLMALIGKLVAAERERDEAMKILRAIDHAHQVLCSWSETQTGAEVAGRWLAAYDARQATPASSDEGGTTDEA